MQDLIQQFKYTGEEHSACGVGFIASRKQESSNRYLKQGLHALSCVEHRGACAADGITGDGSGVMTDIPFDMLGFEKNTIAVATLFLHPNPVKQDAALEIFKSTFEFFGLDILDYREVPTNPDILGKEALNSLPVILQAIIKRPDRSKTDLSFDKRLYHAKQLTKSKLISKGLVDALFFTSLSAKTIVYKALTQAHMLDKFYLDLQNPEYTTRFCLFHRRFSTNTRTSWDKVQPFRLIGHNGEINTIAGNRSWAKSREKMIGAERGEILTREGISDSGSLNEMVEALRYRSSIPNVEDILAIMMPPATKGNDFYKFWSRAMEPWDGPAFITYANGYTIGARLDRNGFRPCRWVRTQNDFYLSSEAGTFEINEEDIQSKGTLYAGRGVTLDLSSGEIYFRDPSHSKENHDAPFNARLTSFPTRLPVQEDSYLHKLSLFSFTDEELSKVIYPMALTGKEAIGSMGDTARLAILSSEPRSFFDYFFQNFSQVTNPPLDYIREKIVTDLMVFLGKKPNIFEPKELIPPSPAYELTSPFLSLAQMKYLRSCIETQTLSDRVIPFELDITFRRSYGTVGFKSKLRALGEEAIKAVKSGHSVLILSDRSCSYDNPLIPSLIALRRVVNSLNDEGLKLNASVVVDSGEIKNTHHASALVGFGAHAVCAYLMLDIARNDTHRSLSGQTADEKEQNIISALENGLLKIMAKSGISVVRSYQSAKLYSALGLGKNVIESLFPGIQSPIGGLEIDQIAERILHQTKALQESANAEDFKPIKSYQYKEYTRGGIGEVHSMTNTRSKIIHDLVRDKKLNLSDMKLFDEFLKLGFDDEPVTIRHLLGLKYPNKPLSLSKVDDISHILKTFGSGAMSFGAISAESQRDIFEAMKEIGGRSNSGEGGENPYYFESGISASTKQIASGRFGVTAEYLMAGQEIQIKVCQGAKPGEGGQLMGLKVNADIAKARFANEGFDLISPPPLHDIYSIEDLKQLIHDLKQLHPKSKVSVKLVAGVNIGTVAVGVAKAGADCIQVSGGEGGTGAASLSSMKHAGLPWEIGLLEVHQSLVENGLRDHIILRTDGGISSGKDIVIASILGAEEFDFGKLLLIAEGCVMARICEKNTCPTGIATHDPKFKAKYKGSKDHVVDTLKYLAEDVRRELSKIGAKSLHEVMGQTQFMEANPNHKQQINNLNLDLSFFLNAPPYSKKESLSGLSDSLNTLNSSIIENIDLNKSETKEYSIFNTDRSIPATLFGKLGLIESENRLSQINKSENKTSLNIENLKIELTFKGSAGQSFGVFQTKHVNMRLIGEANDSVCKSMSGGKTVILPPVNAKYKAEENAIIGNCALYGATGGKLFVKGQAGDRFAVRNSGALAIVEGTGLHACEYMTNGCVIILGETSENVGAGMTGGKIYAYENLGTRINSEYIAEDNLTLSDFEELKYHLEDYSKETNSEKASYIIKDWSNSRSRFKKYVPKSMLIHSSESSEILRHKL